MAALMFLSGLLLSASLRKSRGRYLLGKLSRIGWPYLVWSLVYLVLLAVTTPWRDAAPVSLHDVALVFYAPPTFLWYLAYLLIFYIVAMVLTASLRAWLIPVALVGSLRLVADANWQTMAYLFAFFLAGDVAMRKPGAWAWLTSRPLPLTICGVLLAGTAAASLVGMEVRYAAAWAPGVLAGIVVACPLMTALSSTVAGRWFRLAGEQSIVFYVTHWPVLMLAFFAATRVGVHDPYALTLLLVVAAVLAGAFFVWAWKDLPAGAWLFKFPPLEPARSKTRPARSVTT
jgi:peptidoglycan/LPS O-acetylase OafA/YrhL